MFPLTCLAGDSLTPSLSPETPAGAAGASFTHSPTLTLIVLHVCATCLIDAAVGRACWGLHWISCCWPTAPSSYTPTPAPSHRKWVQCTIHHLLCRPFCCLYSSYVLLTGGDGASAACGGCVGPSAGAPQRHLTDARGSHAVRSAYWKYETSGWRTYRKIL